MTNFTYHDSQTETFNMDDLGNRMSAVLRGDESSTTYAVDVLTNRYDEIGTYDISCSYDNAGNTIVDQDGYQYWYDYENRIIRIEDSGDTPVAFFYYDALDRRILTVDTATSKVTYYYYNAGWQVLTEYGYSVQNYIYGNYIDEVLIMDNGTDDYYYAHNHLFSPVALTDDTGSVVERYEYDAYGKVTVYTDDGDDDIWLTADDTIQGYSAQGNPYTFTGRRLDVLDDGDLDIMYYRNRYYDTYTARFLQQDPLGYVDGMNLYEYVGSDPIFYFDPYGEQWGPPITDKIIEWLLEWITGKIGGSLLDPLWANMGIVKTVEEFKPDEPCQDGKILRKLYSVERRMYIAVRQKEYKKKLFSSGYKFSYSYLFRKLLLEKYKATYYDCICPCYWRLVYEDHIDTEDSNDFETVATSLETIPYGRRVDGQIKMWSTEDYYEWGCGPEPGLETPTFIFF